MANTDSSIFSKKATEKLRSPDDLDKYMRVTNPSAWVMLAACVFLLAGLLAWGVFGTVSTGIEARGAVVDGQAVCFLDPEAASSIGVGDEAVVGGEQMTVAEIAAAPLSRDEVAVGLDSDYLVSSLVQSDWVYQVTFDGNTTGLAEGVPLDVNITSERVAPLSLVLGG